ncbi:MAG: ABC transporter permease [Clostridiales bacterium]|jgi:simple sugar transport system permease protein|nr:ABC transporter permease [Clostridiales bacterium]
MDIKASERKEPLIRIVKRNELSRTQVLALRLSSAVMAVAAGGLFILMLGFNPFMIYASIVSGAFRSSVALQATIKIMIPLLISSLGVSLAFKMKFWNIGAEGQIIAGAIFASYFALYHGLWPRQALIPAMLAAGIVGGGIWGLIPAIFKNKFNTNETLFTLMLNYIALNLIVFLRDGPWADPESGGFPKIARFVPNVQLPKLFGVQIGWIFALALAVFLHVYMKRSKHGYEISVVGESASTAEYAGMNVRWIVLRTMFLSGGICGAAGMIQAAGSDYTLAQSVAGGVGFTAIIVAWLADLSPLGIFIVSFLFSVLSKGCSVMQSTYGISTYSSNVLQGVILFFVLGCEFFIRHRFALRAPEGEAH